MAKPINPYQGAAPAAMAQMGQGISEAGARIGQTLQGGYESMGKGIASGINAVASAYGDYKKMQSGIKASEKAFDTFRSFLSPEVQKSIDDRITEMNKDTSLSLQDKAAFWDQAKAVMGGAINQKFAIDKQQQELDARARLQAAQIASQQGQPMRNAIASFLLPEERQSAAPTSVFGPMEIPQQTSLYSPAPQNTFAAPKRFSIHTQRPEER
jgi:hypothetical protein